MKKTILVITIVGVALLALGVAGVSYAAQTPIVRDIIAGVGRFGPGGPGGVAPDGEGPGGQGPGGQGPLHEYLVPPLAEALGMDTETLEARLADGDTIWSIAEEQGMTLEEFRTMMQEARDSALAEAVTDGVLTQAQADRISEMNGLKFGFGLGGGCICHRGGFGPGLGGREDGLLHDYMESARAEALGLSVDELEARLEAGDRLSTILEDQDLTVEEFQANMAEALPDALEQAVADEVITQAQMETILERMAEREANGFGPGFGPRRGPGFGPGFGGRGGGRWGGPFNAPEGVDA